MCVDVDFLFALVKDEDWLAEAAEEIYRRSGDELWTSQYSLVELMLISYREERDVERVVANANALVRVRGEVDAILTAANYVVDEGLTPFDAVHLVESGEEPIVSSDDSYEEFSERVAVEVNE